MEYIGESERTLTERFCEHLGYINTKKIREPAGEHFHLPGHSKEMKMKSTDPEYRKEWESHLIRKFYTFYEGLNKKP